MDAELRGMVMAYRVTELQALLAFAGKNKQGRKNELQARALELVRAKTPQVVLKMRELYRSLQMTHYGQPMSLTAGNSGATASSMVASRYDNSSYYSAGFNKGQESTFGRSTLQSIGYQRVQSTDGQYRSVPICPDVKLKELPFYDIHSVLIRPTTLLNQGHMPKQETQSSFCLTPSQAAEIASSKEIVPSDGVQNSRMQFNVQVQLRFCALDPEGEQDDQFPQSLLVKVNGRNIQLPHPIPSNRPGVEPKRPSKPLNITNSVKCSPTVTNVITVQWVADSTKNFAMSVNIVKRLTAEELFLRLKSKRIQPSDYTRGRIKEITSAEEEDLCAPTSIRVSVACPLGKNRMAYPCRGTTCKHLQCFDANLFLLMNEKKPTFICPVCNKALKFDELSIDGYFMDVIKELSINDGNDIELYPDGRWEPAIKVKKEIEDVGPPPKRLKKDDGSSAATSLNTTIDLDDDILLVEDDEPSAGPSTSTPATSSSTKNNSGKSAEPEVVDLIDSSDEEDEADTRISGGSRSETMTPTLARESSETPQATNAELDDESDDDEVGIRPRRRAKKVNYIEESSSDSSTTNEGTTTVVQTNTNARRPRSPACIELSDSAPSSPEPPQRQPRAFAAVSSHSSSRSSSASTQPNNNRSGSGSSTLYSSSTTAPTTTMPTPTGIGLPSSPMDPVSSPHLLTPSPSSFSYTSTSSQSASLFSNTPAPPTLPSPSASSLYFSTTSSTVPGYTAYDARSGWEADLNSLINVQQQMSYGQMNLTSYDYMNPSSQQPQQHPSNFPGFGPRPPGSGSGGGYPWL